MLMWGYSLVTTLEMLSLLVYLTLGLLTTLLLWEKIVGQTSALKTNLILFEVISELKVNFLIKSCNMGECASLVVDRSIGSFQL